ncbi:hypothetical protein [Maritimibacter sp. UBA3975]|uniref:hypothetical protein n=1 Tax=Maritimibacter sp. UBA3975 TaxID=1946833 RepID=UPI000C099D69|nr:hypothetical protein [Maritimibacter sp. UBA3975]MAM61459.1 hypothetical protein [Maritimibacter sp.]|tara:strand:- start:6839 stop:7033 length:195 start_codon:yes stop_codon:yes gene_type:complete
MRVYRISVRRFVCDESGAVTVDWVALTAAILMIGMFVGFSVTSSVPTLANKVSGVVSNRSVGLE